MKKILLLSLLTSGMTLTSCDFKDKNGNAPLIENENGELVDNPNYKSEADLKYDERMENIRAAYNSSKVNDGTESITDYETTIEGRKNFTKVFKPKSGAVRIYLLGRDKSTIKLVSGFMSDFSVEQYGNLGYLDTFRKLGFKKVIFNNGSKNVKVINL